MHSRSTSLDAFSIYVKVCGTPVLPKRWFPIAYERGASDHSGMQRREFRLPRPAARTVEVKHKGASFARPRSLEVHLVEAASAAVMNAAGLGGIASPLRKRSQTVAAQNMRLTTVDGKNRASSALPTRTST
jgi:hypothetical protein